MITKNEVNRVAALIEKWGISDPVKQHCKMGEEIAEYIEVRKQLTIHTPDMEKEMGDILFTLIALCIQLDINFMEVYDNTPDQIEPIKPNDLFLFAYYVAKEHLELGGLILKGKDCKRHLTRLCSLYFDECLNESIHHDKALSAVILKNEQKTGKTINGTFVKTSDL